MTTRILCVFAALLAGALADVKECAVHSDGTSTCSQETAGADVTSVLQKTIKFDEEHDGSTLSLLQKKMTMMQGTKRHEKDHDAIDENNLDRNAMDMEEEEEEKHEEQEEEEEADREKDEHEVEDGNKLDGNTMDMKGESGWGWGRRRWSYRRRWYWAPRRRYYWAPRRRYIAPRRRAPRRRAPLPINCQLSSWTSWGQCSSTCGSGSQTRSRWVSVSAAYGGAACTGQTSESKWCNIFPCPVDCVWGGWSAWSVCDEPCGPGMSRRNRTATVTAAHGGKHCTGTAAEEKNCSLKPCPVDCVISEWVNVSDCSLSCGEGQLRQHRTIQTEANHGGVACPEDLERNVTCSPHPCPIDCVLTSWIDDGCCSVTCGEGHQRQLRSVEVAPEHGGRACNSSLERFVSCNFPACPAPPLSGSDNGFSSGSGSGFDYGSISGSGSGFDYGSSSGSGFDYGSSSSSGWAPPLPGYSYGSGSGLDYGSSSGSGLDYGSSSGSGFDYGSSSGSGSGFDTGSSSGSGWAPPLPGYSYGSSYGSGSGFDYGSSSGSGYNYGSSYGSSSASGLDYGSSSGSGSGYSSGSDAAPAPAPAPSSASGSGSTDQWGDEWGSDAEGVSSVGVNIKNGARCGQNRLSLGTNKNSEQCAALASGAQEAQALSKPVLAYSLGQGTHKGECWAETDIDSKLMTAWKACKLKPPCETPSCSLGKGWVSDADFDFFYLEEEESGYYY